MNTAALKKFAPALRTQLMAAIGLKLRHVLTAQTPDYLSTFARQVDALRTLARTDEAGLIERVAYTWFNRFAALRFMDARGWHPFRARVLTPASAAETQPELLKLTRQGALPAELRHHTDPTRLTDLLDGRIPTATPGGDAQGEVYRHLILAACRYYHALLPNLFEKLDDETELLLPDDLLTEQSIVHGFRTEIRDEDCGDGQRANVEVLGWLYQFYISERKDQVMARKSAVPTEDIPAVTQLFTPHWIVRYLVENSLGRLWLLNRPSSTLREHMPYYIDEESGAGVPPAFPPQSGAGVPPAFPGYEAKGEEAGGTPAPLFSKQGEKAGGTPAPLYLHISRPEDIRLCDPACGSGHMLTYAFDLLTLIYEEEGYAPSEIPGLILRYNLYGLDICPRAAQLAELALVLKAREKSRRFFQPEHLVRPHILELQDVRFAERELRDYFQALGLGTLLTAPLLTLLHQFQDAKTFGSLIQPHLSEGEIQQVRIAIEAKDISGQLFLSETRKKVLRVLEQAEMLTQRYQVVVANPPYMGSGAMNSRVKEFALSNFPAGKFDLFAMFIQRGFRLVHVGGLSAMVTMETWMFLSSYESMRTWLLCASHVKSLIHMPYLGKGGTSMGINFGTSATIWQTCANPSSDAQYQCVRYYECNEQGVPFTFPTINERYKRTSAANFMKIPGMPIAYWLSKGELSCFNNAPLKDFAVSGGRCKTHDDQTFVRFVWEVSSKVISQNGPWKFLAHGGDFRKWYGNRERVFAWTESARAAYGLHGGLSNSQFWNKKGICWSDITSAQNSFRIKPDDSEYSSLSPTLIPNNPELMPTILGYLNSVLTRDLLRAINPTLHANVGDVQRLPFVSSVDVSKTVVSAVSLARTDWDNFETSWDFTDLPLLRPGLKATSLELSWRNWDAHCTAAIQRMQALETENNRLFIHAYGLEGELEPEVPEAQITLARADARKDVAAFLSYAIGCMMGRYSLDAPCLILANAGDTLEDYWRKLKSGAGVTPAFPPQSGAGVTPAFPYDEAKEEEAGGTPAPLSGGGMPAPLSFVATQRRLPHWQLEGVIYFVTFRLADSIPQERLRQWQDERQQWLKVHPEPWSVATQQEYNRQFPDRREQWLNNGYGSCVLQRPAVSKIVRSALRFFDGQRYELDEYVIMPNHVHVIVRPLAGFDLSSILHSWKSFSSKEIHKVLGTSGTLWQDESYDHIVRSDEQLAFYRDYIRSNPFKAGLLLVESESGAGVPPAILESGAGVPPAIPCDGAIGEEAGGTPAPLSGGIAGGTPAPLSSFTPDADGILPVLEGEWFEDDIVARTRDFLRVTFGEATLRENLRFIEESLGKDLRKYFLTDFYKDHLQTYKKRPIYWMVQSPKKGFSVLIYLHRYTRDTMNLVLNRYLREYQSKVRNRLPYLAQVQATAESAREKTEARKEAERLTKTLLECEEWERQTLLPLAQARIALDLDDGVKVNYLKLGEALAPIPGLATKEEE